MRTCASHSDEASATASPPAALSSPFFCSIRAVDGPEPSLRFECFLLLPMETNDVDDAETTGTDNVFSESTYTSLPLAMQMMISSLWQQMRSLVSQIILQHLRPVQQRLDMSMFKTVSGCIDSVCADLSQSSQLSLTTRVFVLKLLDSVDTDVAERLKFELLNSDICLQQVHSKPAQTKALNFFITSLPAIAAATVGASQKQEATTVPFWGLLTANAAEKNVCVQLYASELLPTQHNDVMRFIGDSLNNVEHRVNLHVLLCQMYVSREVPSQFRLQRVDHAVCSDEHSGCENASPTQRSEEHDAKSSNHQILDDDECTDDECTDNSMLRLQCPLVSVVPVPSYARVSPAMAMKQISDVLFNAQLQLFSNNEPVPNLFVYKTNAGTIMHLRLRLLKDSDELNKLMRSSGCFKSEADSSQQDGDGEDRAHDEPLMVLEIFGIDTPSAEVVTQFRDMLRNKLDAAALEGLSSKLQRNLAFKVSQDDVMFVCSGRKERSLGVHVSVRLTVVQI